MHTGGGQCFVSHPGTTFGGLIVRKKFYQAGKLIDMMDSMEQWLKEHGFDAIDLRITPSLFASAADDLLSYVLYYRGYQESLELSTYIDYADYKKPFESNYAQGKRTPVNKKEKLGIKGRTLHNREELANFYAILCGNLKKYEAAPVHTLEELYDFSEHRLTNECDFFGIYMPMADGEQMIAGGMVFYFHNANVVHTQYLAAVPDEHHYSPMTFLYDYLIRTMAERGFSKLSFGISTEERGRMLNMGLIHSKEAYGSKHCVNKKYLKQL